MTTKDQDIDIDLSIFKAQTPEDCTREKRLSIDSCISLKRLFCAIKYYTLLNIENNQDHQNIFINFIQEIYNNFLDDFTHVARVHANEIYEINQFLLNNKQFHACNVRKCLYTSRHHRVNQPSQEEINNDNEEEEKDFNLYFIEM